MTEQFRQMTKEWWPDASIGGTTGAKQVYQTHREGKR